MLKRKFSWVYWVIGCIGLMGCFSKPLEQTLWPQYSNAYYKLTQKWLREKKLYFGLDESVIVDCLFKSQEWRQGFIQQWVKTYGLSSQEKIEFARHIMDESKGYVEFFVAISSTREELTKLKLPYSLWAIFLEQKQQKKIYPLDIRELEWAYPKVHKFFPFVQEWQKFYLIRFPYVSNFKNLVFTGPEGKIVFSW
ncbi:MAG: hypothetical protein Q9M37_05245 [Desulfonauticus sp.]|nr:hypothetical protein [Desulfonauticus sp.]